MRLLTATSAPIPWLMSRLQSGVWLCRQWKRLDWDTLERLVGYVVPEIRTAALGKWPSCRKERIRRRGIGRSLVCYSTSPFPTYPDGFPPEVIEPFQEAIGRKIIGNRAASGTRIIDELGAQHMRTGAPIVYTSADSVFQIAAHEEVIPVEELYGLCRLATKITPSAPSGDPGHCPSFPRNPGRLRANIRPS